MAKDTIRGCMLCVHAAAMATARCACSLRWTTQCNHILHFNHMRDDEHCHTSLAKCLHSRMLPSIFTRQLPASMRTAMTFHSTRKSLLQSFCACTTLTVITQPHSRPPHCSDSLSLRCILAVAFLDTC